MATGSSSLMATGRFRHGADSYVQAVSEYGSGYWLLTPLDTPGFTVLVNRGFVPADRRDIAPPSGGSLLPAGHATGARADCETADGL